MHRNQKNTIKPTPSAPLSWPWLQLYDASTTPAAKLGDPVVLNVTGGSGTDVDPYVASLGPFGQARSIVVTIQATGGAGSVSTDASALSDPPVVVGEWLQTDGCVFGESCTSAQQHSGHHVNTLVEGGA